MNRKPEILAPAGSIEALEAAVRCGADAVYLGQKSFSARANSRNFGPEELKQAVSYAHRFGVKIHQALNTVIFDKEIPALRNCIRTACEAGVDALIVQDWGVASIVRELAPDMPLHASTQMAIHSPAGVRLAEKMGFSRVVLARELSREEIQIIRKSTSLELEVFVHGAHCMSMSGQCYMSAFFGGKSGNRGQCAQPCRLPFTAGTGRKDRIGENILSLKDLSLVERLPELAFMGVDSFKIEGRMKRPEYVAAAVTACREALDGGVPDLDKLQSVFSRSGFTSGYFDSHIDREMFGFRRKEDVTAAGPVLKQLAGLYHKDVQRIPISMKLCLQEGKPASLEISDGEFTAFAEGETPREAVSAPVDEGLARRFLGKLGSTPYYLNRLETEIQPGLTMSASAFNGLRRAAAEQLDQLRSNREIPFLDRSCPELPLCGRSSAEPEKWAQFDSFSQITENCWEYFDKIFLPVNEIERHLPELSVRIEKIGAIPPRFLFDSEEKIRCSLDTLRKQGIMNLLCNNAAHIILAGDCGMKPAGGPWLNLNNSYSLLEAKKLGLETAVCSPEIRLDAARELKSAIPLGAVIYGHIPLMSVRNCPLRAQIGCGACKRKGFVTDRKGISFPVRCAHDKSVSFILNAMPIILSDREKEFHFFDFWLFDFTLETAEETDRIIRLYQDGEHPAGEYTRGLYYRGIE